MRSCVRRGAAIDLVLDRKREHRSQFVFAHARGREVIFWQSARTAKQARPAISLPSARAAGQVLEILVDSHERYAWRFDKQKASTTRRALPAGDYAVAVADHIVATVERKSLADLVATLTGGKLRYLLADLTTVSRAALVVEDRWSNVFKLDRVRPAVVADGLAEAQVRFPTVPIVFCETRPLAQERTYRYLGAAIAHHRDHEDANQLERRLLSPGPVPSAEPTTTEVRRWARDSGLAVSSNGRLRPEIWDAYRQRSTSEGDRVDRLRRSRWCTHQHRRGTPWPDEADHRSRFGSPAPNADSCKAGRVDTRPRRTLRCAARSCCCAKTRP